jgi:hypothetical protein
MNGRERIICNFEDILGWHRNVCQLAFCKSALGPLCELRESRTSSVCLDRLGASDRLVRIVGVNRREHEVQIRIDLSVGADGNGDGRYRVARI